MGRSEMDFNLPRVTTMGTVFGVAELPLLEFQGRGWCSSGV